MRLGGWQRLGVIASVMIFGGALYYQIGQRTELSTQMANIDRNICKKQQGANDEVCGRIWQEKFEFYNETHLEWAVISAALTIPCVWLTVWIISALYRWVRGGFASSTE